MTIIWYLKIMIHWPGKARTLCTILALLATMALRGQERVLPNCPFHVIIALDFSASERAFLDEIRTALWALTDRFELNPNSLKMGLISFNRGAQIELSLTGDRHKLDSAINELQIPLRVYATDIHAALELAQEEFELRSTPGIPKFFILISDGDPHAFARGYGFSADLSLASSLKNGSADYDADPVHIFSLYSGEERPYNDDESEWIRQQAVGHMKKLASDDQSFYFFKEHPKLINAIEQISSCL